MRTIVAWVQPWGMSGSGCNHEIRSPRSSHYLISKNSVGGSIPLLEFGLQFWGRQTTLVQHRMHENFKISDLAVRRPSHFRRCTAPCATPRRAAAQAMQRPPRLSATSPRRAPFTPEAFRQRPRTPPPSRRARSPKRTEAKSVRHLSHSLSLSMYITTRAYKLVAKAHCLSSRRSLISATPTDTKGPY